MLLATFTVDLALESKQTNYNIQYEKLKSSIKQINESKTSLEKEFQAMKNKKQKEEKDFLVLHNKKMDTKQKLAPLQRLLEEVSGGDEIKTRSSSRDCRSLNGFNREFVAGSFQSYPRL